jgi:hypothetical protein
MHAAAMSIGYARTQYQINSGSCPVCRQTAHELANAARSCWKLTACDGAARLSFRRFEQHRRAGAKLLEQGRLIRLGRG